MCYHTVLVRVKSINRVKSIKCLVLLNLCTQPYIIDISPQALGNFSENDLVCA